MLYTHSCLTLPVKSTSLFDAGDLVSPSGAKVAAVDAPVLGVAQSPATEIGQWGHVIVIGLQRCRANGAISRGAKLVSSAAGGVRAATGTPVNLLGQALSDAADGEFVTFVMRHMAPSGEIIAPVVTVPAVFPSGAWSVAASATPAALSFTVTGLPDNGGAPITQIDYRLDGGDWHLLVFDAGGLDPGIYHATTDVLGGVEQAAQIRARNSAGPADSWGTARNVTSAAAEAPGESAEILSVLPNGWTAQWDGLPPGLSVAAPAPLYVARQGHDATGAPVTVADTVNVVARLRNPTPGQHTLTADTVVLDNWIYAGDVIVGRENTSPRAYPLAVTGWLTPDLSWIEEDGRIRLRLAVAHGYARNGKPVAAVRFILSDGTTTADQLVTAMTKADYSGSGLSVPVYEWHVPAATLAGLLAGAITVDAEIRPWVGPARLLSANTGLQAMPLTILNKPAEYGVTYAYIAATASATPTASPDPAVAEAHPFATLHAAAIAIKAYNNANRGRNDSSGGVIRLPVGTHVAANWGQGSPSVTAIAFGIVVEAAGGASARDTTILTDDGATVTLTPARVRYRNLTIRRGGAAGAFSDYATGTYANAVATFESCRFDANGQTALTTWIRRVGKLTFLNCDGGATNAGQALNAAIGSKATLTIGCYGAGWAEATVHWSFGTRCPSGNYSPHVDEATPVHAPFIGWNFLTAVSGAQMGISGTTAAIGAPGYAWVGNVIEDHLGGSGPMYRVFADNSTDAAQNVIVMFNTHVGRRSNFLYSDVAGAVTEKSAFLRGNVIRDFNIKSDTFGGNGATGNWPNYFRVGHAYNTYPIGDAAADAVDNLAGSGWLGAFIERGSSFGTNAVPLNEAFVNPQFAGISGATGGGRLHAGTGQSDRSDPLGGLRLPMGSARARGSGQ